MNIRMTLALIGVFGFLILAMYCAKESYRKQNPVEFIGEPKIEGLSKTIIIYKDPLVPLIIYELEREGRKYLVNSQGGIVKIY